MKNGCFAQLRNTFREKSVYNGGQIVLLNEMKKKFKILSVVSERLLNAVVYINKTLLMIKNCYNKL